jgi:hypothetical protein
MLFARSWNPPLPPPRSASVWNVIYAAGSRRKLQAINWLLIDDVVRPRRVEKDIYESASPGRARSVKSGTRPATRPHRPGFASLTRATRYVKNDIYEEKDIYDAIPPPSGAKAFRKILLDCKIGRLMEMLFAQSRNKPDGVPSHRRTSMRPASAERCKQSIGS